MRDLAKIDEELNRINTALGMLGGSGDKIPGSGREMLNLLVLLSIVTLLLGAVFFTYGKISGMAVIGNETNETFGVDDTNISAMTGEFNSTQDKPSVAAQPAVPVPDDIILDIHDSQGRKTSFTLSLSTSYAVDGNMQSASEEALIQTAAEIPATLPIGRHNITLDSDTPDSKITKIELFDLEIVQDSAVELGLDEVDVTKYPQFLDVYAIDPTALSFSSARITAKAKGIRLYKCAEWDFESQRCDGQWEYLMPIVPGEQYVLDITPDDPGLAESNGTFYDGFETGSLSAWTSTSPGGGNLWSISTADPNSGTYHLQVMPQSVTEPASVIEISISTRAYAGVYFSYSRKLVKLDSGDEFKALWYDGSSWNTVEQTGSSSANNPNYIFQNFSLPSGAANSTEFRIRFECTAGAVTEFCLIDDVQVGASTVVGDVTPPPKATDLKADSIGQDWIYWTWTNPPEPDFDHVEVWINDVFMFNTSASSYNSTGLDSFTAYTLQLRSVDATGNINQDWATKTRKTSKVHIHVNGTVKDSDNNKLNIRLEIRNSTGHKIYDQIGTDHGLFILQGDYDITITPQSHLVKKIDIENASLQMDNGRIIDLDDPADNKGFSELYAVNPLINFTSAMVTATAKGNALQKCMDWNFYTRTCEGSWSWVTGLTPSQEYSFTITPDDPGLAETSGRFFEDWETGSAITNNWTIVPGGTSGWYVTTTEGPIGAYHAIARNTDGETTLQNALSTYNYENVSLTFWWATDTNGFDAAEYYYVDWYNGSTWTNLFSFTSGSQTTYTMASYNLPASASNNTDFAIRFRCNVNLGTEGCEADNITLSGDLILSDKFPNVTLISPPDNSSAPVGPVNFSYNVTDINTISNCSLVINGTINKTNTTIQRNTTQNFTTNMGVGTYEWWVSCTNDQGNTAASSSRTITIFAQGETIPPYWSNNKTYPASPVTYNASQAYQFNVTWQDNVNVSEVKIEHNFTGTPANYTVSTHNGDEYYYNYPVLAAGTYYWKEYGTDNSSNRNTTDTWLYVVNKAASAVNLLLNGTDGNYTILQGQYVNMTGYRVAGEGNIYLYLNATLLQSGTGPLTNITQFTNATTYAVRVDYNQTQNYTASSETHYIIVQPDNYAPNVTNVTAIPQTTDLGGAINISADVRDNVAVKNVTARITYPNTTQTDYPMSSIGGYKYAYIFTSLITMPLGQYNVTIIAYDPAGNVNNTEKTYFNLTDVPPVFNYYGDYPDPLKVGSNITIYANITDNKGISSAWVRVNSTNYTMTRNTTSAQVTLNVTTSTGDCTFAAGSTAEQSNTSDNYRSLINGPTTCGWNVQDINDTRFAGVNNITVYVEHVGETGVSPASSTLYVGNATSSTAYGSTVLSTYEGNSNSLEASQGSAVTGEGTDTYVTTGVPGSAAELNNIQIRILHTDSNDLRGADHIYLVVNYKRYNDIYYTSINTTGFPPGQNNYTIYANDTVGQTSHVNGSFIVEYITPPTWLNNRTYPASPATYNASQAYQFNVTWIDDVNVSEVKIEHNFTGTAANYTVSTKNGNEYYYDYPALAAGTYYWKEYGTDNSSNTNMTDTWLYVVNKAASDVNLLLNGTDNNLTILQGQYVNMTGYRVAGEVNISLYRNTTLIANGPGPLTNITRIIPVGSYTFTVVYNSTQNYTASNETHYVIVQADNTRPNVTNVSALPPVVGLADAVNISAKVTDNVYPENVTAMVTYPNSSIFYYPMSHIGSSVYSYVLYTTVTMPLGQYNVTIIAYDPAGNVNNTEKTYFNASDSPPVFNFYNATPNPVAVNYTLTIFANITDNTGVDTVTVFVNGSNHTAVRNITSVQKVLDITNSTGDCTFSFGSTAQQANTSDNYRSLVPQATCGWNLADLYDSRFIGFNNMTVYVEHVAETGVTPLSSALYVGNSTSATAYGSTTLSTYEGDQNQLENVQGSAVTGEGTNSYLLPTMPTTLAQFNNMQFRVYNGDAGGSDLRGVDRIYLLVNYNVSSDVFYFRINATWYPMGWNNYTIYANDTIGQWSSVNGTFRVDYQVPPNVNITSPANGSSFMQGYDINFTGQAYDFEDGNLTKGSLVWASSIDGKLGTGNVLPFATLTPGNHTITLTATDSFSLSTVKSIQISVNASACPGMEAGHFTLVNITIDGNATDWDAVLTNPNNQISDGLSGVDDLDVTQSADRDLRRYAVTWNEEWLWMYVRRSASGSNVVGIVTYFDYNQDTLLNSTDKVLIADWAGSSRLYDTYLFNYSPANVSGDPITGDGVPEPGTVTNQVNLESKIFGGTDPGIVLEWRARWSDLGMAACTPLVAHVSSTRGTGKQVPGNVEDNMGLFDGRIYGIKFYPDSIKSGKQGTTVTHQHTLRNIGNLPDLFNFNITGTTPGYNVTVFYANGTLLTDTDSDGRMDTGYILPSYGITLYVNISIPITAVSGDIDVTKLTAISKVSNTTNASVTDTTVVGAIAVIPNNQGLATNGSVVTYQHTIYNNDIPTVVNVNMTSSQGYNVTVHYTNGTQLTDTNNDTLPDVGQINEGSSLPILARIYVSSSATIGMVDNTTIMANSTYGESGRAYDVTTLAPYLTIIPNITRAGGQGTAVFLVHNITYVSNETGTVDLTYNQSQPFTLQMYHDNYITPLTDTNGNSIIDAGLFGINGYTKTIIAKIIIPETAPINTTDIIYYNVSTNASTYKGYARDNVSVQKLVSYIDSNFQLQSYYFKQTETVYAQAYALDMAWVYFQYIDPNATVMRLSPYVPVDTMRQADDNYYLNASDLSGQWQLVLYNKQGSAEITRINYWVNTPPVILNISDYPDPAYQGDIVNFTANITAGELRWFPNETVVLGALLEIAGQNHSMTGPNTTSGIGGYYFDGLDTANITPGNYTYRVFAYDNFTFYNVSIPASGSIVIRAYNFTNVSGVITDTRYNPVSSTLYIYNSTGHVVWTDDETYSFYLYRGEPYNVTIIPASGSIKEITYVGVIFPPTLLNFTRLEDVQENDTDKPDEIRNWTEAITWWTHPNFYYTRTKINFTYGAGTDMYFWKCSDWNFDNRTCNNNNFQVIQNLSDGPGWAVVYLSPGDPGAGAGRAPDYSESVKVWDVTGLNETGRRYNGTFAGEFYDLQSINFTIGKSYRIEVFVTQIIDKAIGILRDPYYDNIPDDWAIDVNGTDYPNITQVNGSVVIDPFVATITAGTEANTQKLIWDAAPPNKTVSDIDVNETVKLWFVADLPINASNQTHTGHFLGKSKGHDAEITNNLTILTGQPPCTVNLTFPNNGNDTLINRTLTFLWQPACDPDNQTLTYSINITSEFCSDIYDTNISATNYTSIYELGTYDECGWYNWTVRAYDGYYYGNWSDIWNFSIQPYIALFLINNTVDFGDADNDQTNDTTDDNPPPFLMRSDGNVFTDVVNVTANQSFFTGESYTDSDFQMKVDNSTELGSFNWTGSAFNWINLTTIQKIIDYLDWHDQNDSAEIDVKVHVPLDETPGLKVTGLVFYGEQS